MPGTLNGKVAVVTGGSRGIGAGIARRLARDGAQVVITYSNSKPAADELVLAIEAAGGRAMSVRADSADAVATRTAINDAVKKLGRLDVLVNNAGVAVVAPLDEFKIEDFDRMVAINVRAVFVASQEAARHMKQGGRIINIGSTNADRMPFVGGAVYAMTKAAVAGLTRGLARDLGGRGITVNAVQPGPIDTEMNPKEGPSAAMLKGLMAIKRFGTADEIAAMVAYLASDEAGFVTGACLTIDGGFQT